MNTHDKTWCDQDGHALYEIYADFNHWLEHENEGQAILESYGINGLSQPSKAFYAGDKEKFQQAFDEYRKNCLHEVLSFLNTSGDDHWFKRHSARFKQLIECLANGSVVPFIGAGISVDGGFPTWEDHLREQGKTAGIESIHIEKLLADGKYEKIIEEIENKRGHEVFIKDLYDAFDRRGIIPETFQQITALFTDKIITTNYDSLIELAYNEKFKDNNAIQIINGSDVSLRPATDRLSIIKLHGDIKKPQKCILSKNQYDEAYGVDTLDMERPLPKRLAEHFKTNSLLFLGCSLHNDRTVEVFRAVKKQIGDEEIPKHFSIEQAPEFENAFADRNEYLLKLGITAIWFEKTQFKMIEKLLRLAKTELLYGRATAPISPPVELTDNQNTSQSGIELSHFLRDLNDLLPLMYWLHRPVPQKETSNYLHAMQCLFHAWSFFTETTNKHLLECLDFILRALSNNPDFDGYTHSKLSVAFKCIQYYLHTISVDNYLTDDFAWNCHEMMAIPSIQFKDVLANSPPESKFDCHAIRLIIALLKHGLNQERSPKQFCELPSTVNAEFGDYLSLMLSSKLGLLSPDRLDDMLGDIHSSCQQAWEQFDRQPKMGFLGTIKFKLLGLFNAKR